MIIVNRLLMFSFISTTLFFDGDINAGLHLDSCRESDLLSGINKLIDDYSFSEKKILSCDDLHQVAEIPNDSLLIFTKRSRGKNLICLSDSRKTKKCKYKIGYLTGPGDSTYKLCKMLKTECTNKMKIYPLTETVERLYLKPSTLIR